MRLLLRANAHRPVWADGTEVGVEVAASPDTPTRPERWAWHIRLMDDKAPLGVVPSHAPHDDSAPSTDPTATRKTRVALSAGARGTLEVEVDPQLVDASTEVHAGTDLVLQRSEAELLALVASSGEVVLENRHHLSAGDAVVLTGDDPLSADVSATHGSVVLIRLNAPDGRPVSWVP